MSPLLMSVIAFACVLGGTFLGMFLRNRLPEHHLSAATKDVVRRPNFSNAVDYGGEVTQLIRKTEFYSKFCRRTLLASLHAWDTRVYDVAIK